MIVIGSKSKRVTIGEDAQSNTLRKPMITSFDDQLMGIRMLSMTLCVRFECILMLLDSFLKAPNRYSLFALYNNSEQFSMNLPRYSSFV